MRKTALLAFLAMAAPAMAADHAAPAKDAGHEPKKGGKPGTNVDMPYLMAPLINADGKLMGYAYISSRLTASSEGVVTDVREKLPFIQDLMVRNVNNLSVAVPDDPEKVDIAGVEARLLADARKVMGQGKVKQIIVCTVQIAELRPKQTPALHTPPEVATAHGAPPPKNPVKSRCES
ncbi:MAG: hypothetical protein V4601_05185 [Pseudomonadota bacterium]